MSKRFCTMLAAAMAVTGGAMAQWITEVSPNPPGSNDWTQGRQFIEIMGTPGHTIANDVYLLCIQGGTRAAFEPNNPGLLEVVIPLGGLRFGSNGLLLLRDAPPTTVLLTNRNGVNMGPDPNTTAVYNLLPLGGATGNDPGLWDIYNDAETIVLVKGAPAGGWIRNTDLDASPEDGTIDGSIFGDGNNPIVTLDGLSYLANGSSDTNPQWEYDQFSGIFKYGFLQDGQGSGTWEPNYIYRVMSTQGGPAIGTPFDSRGWFSGDDTGGSLGPYLWHPTTINNSNGFANYGYANNTELNNPDPALGAAISPGWVNRKISNGLSRTLTAVIDFGSCPPPSTVTVTHRLAGEVEWLTQNVTLTGNQFTVNWPMGVYEATIQPPLFLRRKFDIDTRAANDTVTLMLIGGDVDGSNMVDSDDFDILVGAFGTSNGQSGYVATADLDCNDIIDSDDFDILVASFGITGDN